MPAKPGRVRGVVHMYALGGAGVAPGPFKLNEPVNTAPTSSLRGTALTQCEVIACSDCPSTESFRRRYVMEGRYLPTTPDLHFLRESPLRLSETFPCPLSSPPPWRNPVTRPTCHARIE